MDDRPRKNKVGLAISGGLLGLFLIVLAYGSIESRWGALKGAFYILLALIVGIAWVCHVTWFSARRRHALGRKAHPWIVFFVGVLIFGGALEIVGRLGAVVRNYEIRKALDAGLREDCQHLLNTWTPTDEVYILFTEPEFSKLPISIKMLDPITVENLNREGVDLPSNVGICKNGFGGFAQGIRVFRNDRDASDFEKKTSEGHERIEPCVYYCWGSE